MAAAHARISNDGIARLRPLGHATVGVRRALARAPQGRYHPAGLRLTLEAPWRVI